MKNILSPSILSADFSKLGEQIALVDKAGAPYIHIDVMDGLFVPSISYGMPVIRSIRKITDKIFDVHLMICEPERYIDEFIDCGADIITFHLEATEKAQEIIEKIHRRGKKAGISIKPGTDTEAVRPYLSCVDMILVMTVEPGFGGQSYLDYCTEKVKAVKKMVEECGREIAIEVDGGISLDNISMVLSAGANVAVAGSAVFKGDIAGNVEAFLKTMQ
ncbi:MAG: ribulose-phosphate 3-epimerase [Lachnospiraceae bacterium]